MSVVIKSNFDALIAGAEVKAGLAVQKTARDIQDGAARRSRVDTGHMQGAWTVESDGDLEAIVANGAEYAIYNEYGTHKMSAQPMARPAAQVAYPAFKAAMRQVFS